MKIIIGCLIGLVLGILYGFFVSKFIVEKLKYPFFSNKFWYCFSIGYIILIIVELIILYCF